VNAQLTPTKVAVNVCQVHTIVLGAMEQLICAKALPHARLEVIPFQQAIVRVQLLIAAVPTVWGQVVFGATLEWELAIAEDQEAHALLAHHLTTLLASVHLTLFLDVQNA